MANPIHHHQRNRIAPLYTPAPQKKEEGLFQKIANIFCCCCFSAKAKQLQRLQLGGKGHEPPAASHVQGLLAERIAGQQPLALVRVPQREEASPAGRRLTRARARAPAGRGAGSAP